MQQLHLTETKGEEELRAQEASRPLHQFRHQVQREQEYIRRHNNQGTSSSVYRNEARWDLDKADLDEISYHVVRNRWIEQGIWYSGWHREPGLKWMNEMPWEEVQGVDAVTTEQYDLSRYNHPAYEASAPWPKHFDDTIPDRGLDPAQSTKASEDENLPSHHLPTPPKSRNHSPSCEMEHLLSLGGTPPQRRSSWPETR